MIDEFSGTVEIGTSPQATWRVIEDPLALGRVLPDCESVAPDGNGGLNIVVAVRQMFMTVRVDLHVTYHDVDRPNHLRLDLEGHPRGLGGALRLSVPIEIRSTSSGSRVDYRGSLVVDGALSSFRKQILEALHVQVDRLLRNVEREAGPAPGGG